MKLFPLPLLVICGITEHKREALKSYSGLTEMFKKDKRILNRSLFSRVVIFLLFSFYIGV